MKRYPPPFVLLAVLPAALLALPASLLFGLLLEVLVFRHLYERDHLEQVLATFGVILGFVVMMALDNLFRG